MTCSPEKPSRDTLWKVLSREASLVFESSRSLPVHPRVKPEELRARLARYDFLSPRALSEVLSDAAWMLRRFTMHTATPRQMGLYNPPPDLASVLADALVALYNPQLAVWASAPAAVEIEQHCLAHIAALFGLDPIGTARHFTHGGAESNLTAVALALAHAAPRSPSEGLLSLGAQPVVYASAESHGSIRKAAGVTGIGQGFVRSVAVDNEQRMSPEALSLAIAQDLADGLLPLMVVATAGTTSTGAIDPLWAIADLCQEKKLWMHVDAAYGGIAAISPLHRKILRGIERADSVSCDAHKGFGVAMGAGMFFTRHPSAARAAFEVRSGYMPVTVHSDRVDPYLCTLPWSRRFIGLKVFLTLASRGLPAMAASYEGQCERADSLRAMLSKHGWRVIHRSELPVVCFDHPSVEASALGGIAAKLQRRDIAWISEVRLSDGRRALRACITHPETSDDDLRALCEGLEALR